MTTYTVKVEEDGSTAWYLDGKIRRIEGPTFGYTHHSKFWYLHDKLHRTDGPAIEWANGSKSWYLNGKQLTDVEWLEAVTPKKPSCAGKIVEIDNVKYRLIEA